MREGDTQQITVSIIMPAYNAEKHIEEAICSVLSQTYENWELLVIDDCSSDRTAELAKAFETVDSRIRFFRNAQNIGVAGTRNRGIDIATGEWVALLDSDDYWHKDKLEKQLKKAYESRADIIYCSYTLADKNGKCLKDYVVPQKASYNLVLKENVLSCSTVLIRRSALIKHKFSEEYYHEDYALWLELLRAGYKAEACSEILSNYRIAQGTRSSNKYRAAKNRWIIYRKAEKLSLVKSAWAFIGYAYYAIIKHKMV